MYSLADPDRDGSWKGKIGRAFQELSYHLIRSGSFSELEHVGCNLRFVYNKSMLGLASQLIDDYQPLELNKTLAREQAKCMEKLCVNEYRSFVSRNLHILASHPALTWQQAFNEKSSSQPAVDVRTILQTTSLPDSERNLMEWSSKPVNVDPCYMTISNLPQPMTSVSVSPDNLYFACGGLDGVVHLYDFKTGKELKSFRGHADSITDVCFAGRDKLCSASMDNVVSIWDVENGHRLFALKRHQRRVNSCASDLSGKLLATASWDCMIKVWSVKKGEEVCEFKVGSPVNCVAFHPEGQLIVSGQWDSTIKIWDVFHKTKKAVLRGHKSSVRDVAYSPSGRHIASAALDGDVKLWAAYAGSQVGNIHGHALPINKLIFSPTGKELITVSDDHKIKVWSGHLGQPISTLGQEDLGPTMSVSISPSRETVAVGYHSGYIRVYDILSGSELQGRKVHTASVKCLKYMSESYLMSGSDDNTVMILKTNLKNACVIAEHTKPVMCIDMCRDYMATASEDCTCRLYENPLKFGGKPQMTETTRICILGSHTGPVTSCSFNRDGTMIATSSRDMTVKIWDVVDVGLNADNPTPMQTLQDCHADWVTDCKWSNIGDSLVTASSDFNLKVWDTRNGKEKMKMTGHMGSVNHVGYSYGCIMSTCSDGSVKMWSHKGVEITTLYGHTQRANGCDISVQLSEDDKQNVQDDWSSYGLQDKKVLQPKLENVIVATCSDDGTARLWYPMQANELACLTGHSDKVIAVSSSSQGQLCTSSLDNSIKLWSCDQESRAVIGCHDTPVTFISSLLGGTAVFTGSRDGNIKILESELVTVNGQQHLKYSCSISIKAHEMAVTCGSWLGPNNLVTGSDDCSIVIWTVTRTNGKISRLTKYKTWFTKSPLLSLVTNGDDKVTAMANTFIFTSEWDGALIAWNTMGKMVAELQTLYSFTEWLLKLHMDGSDKLLATTTDGYVIKYNVEKVVQKNAKPTITEIMKIRIPMGRDIVSARNVEAYWVLAISGNERGFFTGDSLGQVTCMTKRGYEYHPKQSMKIHSLELTCVVKTGKYLFTASRDKTIKVWDESMSQVGQFFCASPVTSMKVLDGSLMQFVPILYGDELGYIHLLLWRTGQQ